MLDFLQLRSVVVKSTGINYSIWVWDQTFTNLLNTHLKWVKFLMTWRENGWYAIGIRRVIIFQRELLKNMPTINYCR